MIIDNLGDKSPGENKCKIDYTKGIIHWFIFEKMFTSFSLLLHAAKSICCSYLLVCGVLYLLVCKSYACLYATLMHAYYSYLLKRRGEEKKIWLHLFWCLPDTSSDCWVLQTFPINHKWWMRGSIRQKYLNWKNPFMRNWSYIRCNAPFAQMWFSLHYNQLAFVTIKWHSLQSTGIHYNAIKCGTHYITIKSMLHLCCNPCFQITINLFFLPWVPTLRN